MEDLDRILAHQYHSAKRRLNLVKRLRKVCTYKKDLDMIERQLQRSLTYYENMIHDKSILEKKVVREKETDILTRNFMRSFIKGMFAYTTLSYKMAMSYWDNYLSFWNVNKEK